MSIPARPTTADDSRHDPIDYAEIFATTDADIAAGWYYTLEATGTFGRSVIERLRRMRPQAYTRAHHS